MKNGGTMNIERNTIIKGRLDYKRKITAVSQDFVVYDLTTIQSRFGSFTVGEHFVRFRGKGKRNWIDLCETHMIFDFIPKD